MATVVGDVLEQLTDYGVHQRPLKLRMWYQVVTNPGDPELTAQDLLSALVSVSFPGVLRTLMSPQALLDCMKAYVRFGVGPFAIKNEAPGFVHLSVPGLQPSGEALPDSVPLTVEWEQTAVSAVANGRAFISGIREADVEGNRITSAFQTGPLATFESEMESFQTPSGITGSDGGVYRQILVSREDSLGVPPLQTYGAPLDVTGTMCNPVLKNQKRRQSRWEGASRA